MDTTRQLIRWALPGWIALLFFAGLRAITLLAEGDIGQFALAEGTFFSHVRDALVPLAAASVPFGFVIYQAYYWLYWHASFPRWCQGFTNSYDRGGEILRHVKDVKWEQIVGRGFERIIVRESEKDLPSDPFQIRISVKIQRKWRFLALRREYIYKKEPARIVILIERWRIRPHVRVENSEGDNHGELTLILGTFKDGNIVAKYQAHWELAESVWQLALGADLYNERTVEHLGQRTNFLMDIYHGLGACEMGLILATIAHLVFLPIAPDSQVYFFSSWARMAQIILVNYAISYSVYRVFRRVRKDSYSNCMNIRRDAITYVVRSCESKWIDNTRQATERAQNKVEREALTLFKVESGENDISM